jgi:tetratricopeptide (TPR) repeat protein/TolB-like protein
MHLRAVLPVALLLLPLLELSAQCPDGSPPPCRITAIPARVSIDSNALAILPFRVSGPPEAQYLREGMLDLMSVALDGFAGWRVIQPRALLRQIGPETGSFDVPQAARLAREAGAARFVLGSVVTLGPELRVQAELYESVRGQPIASVRARGTLALPGPVADTIAGGLARLRLARYPGVARRPLAEYTTTSPRALEAYLVGEQLARRARWQEAAESLTAAIGRDSTFALAYYGLYRAITWGNAAPIFPTARERPASAYTIDEVIQSALRHLDRAPPRQRRLLEFVSTVKRVDALRLADALERDYPDDADAALERGDAYYHLGLQMGEPPQQALASLRRAIALDPAVPEAYLHVVQLLCMMGDTAGAWQAFRPLQAAAPDWEATQAIGAVMRAGFRGEDPAAHSIADPTVAAMTGRYALWALDAAPARAVALADSFAARAAASDHPPNDRVSALLRRHAYRLAQGRYAAAWDMLRDAALVDPDGRQVLGATVLHHLVTGAHAGEATEAARRLATAGDTLPLWATVVLAWRVTAVAPPDSALAALPALLAGQSYPQFRSALLEGLSGLVALRSGDSATARRGLAAANVSWIELRDIEEFFPNPYLALITARFDRAGGDLDAAARRLSETVGSIGIIWRAQAEELRGQIAEQRGDTAAAIRGYRNFIDLWKDADSALQPRVAAARAAIARLERP